jgi:hypothetical protein
VQNLEAWQLLLVPTVATADGLMRVADNDGKPVPLVPRPSAPPPASRQEASAPAAWGPAQVLRALRAYATGDEVRGVRGKLRQKLAALRARFRSEAPEHELLQQVARGLTTLGPAVEGPAVENDVPPALLAIPALIELDARRSRR